MSQSGDRTPKVEEYVRVSPPRKEAAFHSSLGLFLIPIGEGEDTERGVHKECHRLVFGESGSVGVVIKQIVGKQRRRCQHKADQCEL